MSPLRILLVLTALAALATLATLAGFSRMESLREGRRQELVESVRLDHIDLARRVATLLTLGRHQSQLVASLPQASALLRDPDDADALATLRVVLASFPGMLGLTLEDPSGTARLTLGETEAAHDDVVRHDATGATPPPPALPLSAPLSGDAAVPGRVTLRLDLSGLLAAVSGSTPLEGVTSRLLQAEDVPATATEPDLTVMPARDEGDGLLLTCVITGPCPMRMETRVPAEALEAAMAPLRQEYLWIVGTVVGFTAMLGLGGAVVLRLAQRSFRLRETEHYLRWIRRVTDRYRALMEGAADMILIVEPGSGRIREANAAARDALGLPEAEGRGSRLPPVEQVMVDASRPGLREAIASAATTGRPASVGGLQARGAGDTALDVDAQVARVDLDDESVLQVSLRDMTSRREMEDQLRLAERLGSLGLLTAGVAHEINNPLEGIGNYLELVDRDDVPADRRRYLASQVRRGLERIREIVQHLLSFARPAPPGGEADLAQVVDAALALASYHGRFKSVAVERVGLDAPLPVRGDSGRLEQVVLNLLLNAAQAMEGRGRVRLRAVRIVREERPWIELAVEDEGPGIPPEHRDAIFDPFFSRHGGTGLGLAVSFGIVRAHDGTLTAHDRPGGGAVFRLRLPAASSAPPGGPQP